MSVDFAVPAGWLFTGTPIEIRMGIPGSHPDQIDFDNVRLRAVRSKPASPCVPAPKGMVVSLRAEADLTDDFSHPVFGPGIRYAEGKVGAAFLFDGSNQVVLPDSPDLDGDTFTIETWVFPTVLDGAVNIIANKESGSQFYEFQYEMGIRGPVIDVPGTIPVGNVAFYLGGVTGLPDDYGGWVDGLAQAPVGRWTHVALAVSPGTATVYVDGKATRRLTGLGGSLRKTNGPLKIGARDDSFGARDRFKGRIDEFSFYGRALTDEEVSRVHLAGAAGKCTEATLPVVFGVPLDQTVPTGSDVEFSVATLGPYPVRIQWRFEGGEIPGATNGSLRLSSVKPSASGRYEVSVCNAAGCAPTMAAVLQVIPDPCTPAPASLVGWWRAEGDLKDQLGNGSGINAGSAKIGAGFSGRGFGFLGTGIGVVVGNPVPFRNQDFTVESWIKRADARSASAGGFGGVIFSGGENSYGVAIEPNGELVLSWVGVSKVASTNRITDVFWHHIAVTKSGADVRFYIDGRPAGSVKYAPTFTFATPFAIGSLGATFGQNYTFTGDLDEISLYARALTSQEVASVYQAGENGKCIKSVSPPPLVAPSVLAGPADAIVQVATDATFSVVATGAGPLRYQWRFQDTDITGATNAQLLLPKVRKSAEGRYSVTVCNGAGCAPVVSAILSVEAPPAVVRIGDATAKAPDLFSVPVVLVGNGEENAVGFSIGFDPRLLMFVGAEGGAGAGGSSTRLNSSQATNGSVGILVGLQLGTRFPRGTNELMRLRFQPKALAAEVVTLVQISDSPAKRQLADVEGITLPVVWTGGNVRILATDFEGDVGPAPAGDRRVTAADWMLIGRYVAGLDVPADNSLFQRADCAPLSTGGNGRLTVADWVQAGRFAGELDPLKPATGPAAPVDRTSGTPGGGHALPQSSGPRFVSISGGEFRAGEVKVVSVRLAASGDENALAFSVRHDPTRLRFVGADIGADATGAVVNVNALQASDGRIGLVLALPASAKFPAGDIEVAKLRFAGLPGGTGPMDLAFADAPVFREVASATAETLPSLWADTVFTVASRTLGFRIVQTLDGPAIEVSWLKETTGVTLESATDPVGGKWSPVAAVTVDDGASRIVTLPLSATSYYYRLVVP